MRPALETALTRDGGRAFTPEFAAPEQLTGGVVTTATDVHALGTLVYLLLAGAHPAGPARSSRSASEGHRRHRAPPSVRNRHGGRRRRAIDDRRGPAPPAPRRSGHDRREGSEESRRRTLPVRGRDGGGPPALPRPRADRSAAGHVRISRGQVRAAAPDRRRPRGSGDDRGSGGGRGDPLAGQGGAPAARRGRGAARPRHRFERVPGVSPERGRSRRQEVRRRRSARGRRERRRKTVPGRRSSPCRASRGNRHAAPAAQRWEKAQPVLERAEKAASRSSDPPFALAPAARSRSPGRERKARGGRGPDREGARRSPAGPAARAASRRVPRALERVRLLHGRGRAHGPPRVRSAVRAGDVAGAVSRDPPRRQGRARLRLLPDATERESGRGVRRAREGARA